MFDRKIFNMIFTLFLLFKLTPADAITDHYYSPPSYDNYQYGPATIQCVVEAARRQNVPANLLLALSSIEGGKNGQFVKNSNGSYDIGHFQINTIHWKKQGSFYAFPEITQHEVAWRGCYNAELAGWLLNRVLNEKNEQDFWTKAANYHSKTPKYNAIYRQKLIKLAIDWGKWLQDNQDEFVVSYR